MATAPADVAAAKSEVCAAVDARSEMLVRVARDIHAHPEENFEERYAHDLLVDVLASEGLTTEPGAFGLPTAFRATAGREGPIIAVLLEYDALPGLGHACGHNIIAAAGLGAGLAAATMAERLGGRVVLLGTPAEEGEAARSS